MRNPPARADKANGSVRSVEKALALVRALSTAGQGFALSDLAQRLEMNESTAHHLLATLRRAGFVEQDGQTRAYRLGYGLVGLVVRFLSGTDLYSAGTGPVRELRDRTGETAYLTVVSGRDMVAVVEIVGSKPIQARRTLFPGEPALHSTASGKVHFAHLPPQRLGAVLSSIGLTRFTPNTIADADALRAELAAIRRQGYALDREENVAGVMCVAAPVFGADGEQVATASVAFPRAGDERVAELIPPVVATAATVSRNLGYAMVGAG
jgi:DNA-binding IclR family transcriptional regulator